MRDTSPLAVGSNQFANLDCAVFYDRLEFRRSAQCALGIYVYVLDFRVDSHQCAIGRRKKKWGAYNAHRQENDKDAGAGCLGPYGSRSMEEARHVRTYRLATELRIDNTACFDHPVFLFLNSSNKSARN